MFVDMKIFEHLEDTAKVLFSEKDLRRCGIDTLFAEQYDSVDHPAVVRQTDLSTYLGTMVMSLLGARIRRLLPSTRGWPKRQVTSYS
jgi:hypothetical protein